MPALAGMRKSALVSGGGSAPGERRLLYCKRGQGAMAASRVAVIGGDGIGPEVIDQAIRVADAALRHDKGAIEWNRLPWSSTYYKQTGHMMPADGWDQLRQHD